MNNQDAFDATQRVYLDNDGHPSTPPHRPSRPSTPPRPTPSQRAARKKKQRRITLISLCAAAAVLVIALIIILITMLTRPPEDNGLILNNVNAAGVNLGGMTPEQAKTALKEATDDTYSVLDMTVTVLDTTLTLSPADTGARLDVDAVVNAAYNYGRTGSRADQQRAQEQAQHSGYTVPILEYLNLDTEYIRSELNQLGYQFSTTLSQSSYSLEGDPPAMTQEVYDTTVVYQTLTVRIGTAEYGLNIDKLYEQILDAYEINLFRVTGECTVVAPDPLDYEAICLASGCVAPVNALFNSETYEVTEEIYGYGFTAEELKSLVESAHYGDTVTINLCFVKPDITKEFYDDMFKDTLASFSTEISSDWGWNENLKKACSLLNGIYVKPGEEFSFNSVIGEPTYRSGFQSAGVYLGKSYQELVGGGLCQVSSTLYYCALMADLDILERHSHSIATDYIQPGFDAEIYYGNMDFRFRNNTEFPIRIDASVSGGELMIAFVGTDSRDYTVELSFKIDETYEPETVYNTMIEDNAGNYKEGDILREGITGYSISTYITRYDKETGEMLGELIDGEVVGEILIAESYYAKQDQVLVQIYHPPVVVPPDDPTDPTDPTDPSDPTDPTDPTDPSDPTEPTDPSDPTDPIDPPNPTQPSDQTE